jgi:hypothetical protein
MMATVAALANRCNRRAVRETDIAPALRAVCWVSNQSREMVMQKKSVDMLFI